jgi:AraC family transcriptional regulator, L-rhamnose operon transcriptional activator RhaR
MDTSRRLRYHARDIFPTAHLWVDAKLHRLHRDTPSHDHDFMEAVLILGGEGVHQSAHGEQILQAGDAFLMRPRAWHRFVECRDLQVYNCCFGVELLRRELSGILQEPALNYLLLSGPLAQKAFGILSLHLPLEELVVCRELLETIAETDESPATLNSVEKVGYLILFLARLARAVPALPVALPRTTALHPAVRLCIELLENDAAHEWTLGQLADAAHLEPSHFVRQFKRGTGLAPMAYLARFRAEQAARLLLRTDESVTAIACQVGWPDPNYFARRFRSHFGLSPTEYRRMRRGDGGF